MKVENKVKMALAKALECCKKKRAFASINHTKARNIGSCPMLG
jgi:hypothetical protein